MLILIKRAYYQMPIILFNSGVYEKGTKTNQIGKFECIETFVLDYIAKNICADHRRFANVNSLKIYESNEDGA